jgi:serine/threonine-protein kinase
MSRALGSRYEVEDILGRGAFGTVWRGTVRDTGESVAIKMLREDLANDSEVVTRFLHERKALTSLRHASVVAVRDLVVEGDQLALVMQLVNGPDLKEYLRERGRLEAAEAALLVADVAQALAAAHRANIIHRDVKPANVLLDHVNGGLRPLLTDFGVARLADVPSVTKTHQVVGTPYYLSPEVIAGRGITPAMDVYAAGVMTYELCAGRVPFTGEDAMSVFRAHLDEEPVRPAGLSDGLWEVITRCMDKDPTHRPDAAGLALRLRELFGLTGSPESIDRAATTVPVRIDKAAGTVLLPAVEPSTRKLPPVGPAAANNPTVVNPPKRPTPTSMLVNPTPNGPGGTRVDAAAMGGVEGAGPNGAPANAQAPYAGWDAPPSRDALVGYRPRSATQPQAAQNYPQAGFSPQGPQPAPTARYTAAPPADPRFAPQPNGYQPAPQPAYPPARYQDPRRRENPPRRPVDAYPPPRAAREPRRRRGLGCGCLMQLAVLVFVVVVALYIAVRIDQNVHLWWQHVQENFNSWLTSRATRRRTR